MHNFQFKIKSTKINKNTYVAFHVLDKFSQMMFNNRPILIYQETTYKKVYAS